MPHRIALISDHASPLAAAGGVDSGGQNVYVACVARNLARLGHSVDVFTRCDSPDLAPIVEWQPGVRVVHVPAGPPEFVRKERLLPMMEEFAAFTRRFCEREGGYDLVHANFFMSGLVAGELKAALGIPFLITFHALGLVRRLHQGDADEFPPERIDIERRLIADADAIVAECPQDLDDLVQLYGANANGIAVIPCGYEPKQFWPVERRFARKTLGFEPDRKLVLHLGRLVPRKGADNVIRALGRLGGRQRDGAALLIVGGNSDIPDPALTPEIRRLREIARSEGVADRVIFTGRRSREVLKLYYSAADAFVTTPWYEPFGITPVEAMACGTPVIGSNVGGIKYSVVHNETGFLVPPNEPDALARQLGEVCGNTRLGRRLGRAALRRAQRLFTWRTVTAAIAALYDDVRAGKAPSFGRVRDVAAAA
ncbi:MAG TPA: glycosyltransferase [Gammaproteobacteria bacterium]|nr:glycosyltransferase [Gammaproteobacteria bacterium]